MDILQALHIYHNNVTLGGKVKTNQLPSSALSILSILNKEYADIVNGSKLVQEIISPAQYSFLIERLNHANHTASPTKLFSEDQVNQTLQTPDISEINLPFLGEREVYLRFSTAVYPTIFKDKLRIGQVFNLIGHQPSIGIVVAIEDKEIIVKPQQIGQYTFARYLKWWQYNLSNSKWITDNCFLKSETDATFVARCHTSQFTTLSQIQWTLSYNNETIARGFNSIVKDLCMLKRTNSMFKEGKYTLNAKYMLNAVTVSRQTKQDYQLYENSNLLEFPSILNLK
jgi:hypothetical protein